MDAEISTEEVRELLDDEDPPVVVDIRDPTAFERGHIPGSRNIPFGELPTRVAELGDADRVVTVCPHGKASVQAARLIKSFEGTADARVESMEGGLEEWEWDLDRDAEPAEADEGPQSPF